jgi:hypothetical protein
MFLVVFRSDKLMVRPQGFEPATYGFKQKGLLWKAWNGLKRITNDCDTGPFQYG